MTEWGYCSADQMRDFSDKTYPTKEEAIAAGRDLFHGETEWFCVGKVERCRAEDYVDRLAEQAIEVIEESATDCEWSHVDDDLFAGLPSDKGAVNILKALLKSWAKMNLTSRYWQLRDCERVEVEEG